MRINNTRDGRARNQTVFWGIFLLVAVVVSAVIGFGAYRGSGEPGNICFSSDGSLIAHTYVKRIDLPLPPEMPTLYSTVYLQWCPVNQVTSRHSVKIDSYGKSFILRIPYTWRRNRLICRSGCTRPVREKIGIDCKVIIVLINAYMFDIIS